MIMFASILFVAALSITAYGCGNGEPEIPAQSETTKPSEGNNEETNESMRMNIIIGNKTITAMMEDNAAGLDFLSRLPLEATIEDFNNTTEKIFYPRPTLDLAGVTRGCAPVPGDNIASSESNTGEVHLSILKDGGNTMITNLCFSPGNRNFWHYHSNAEQTLLVLDGEGYNQEESQEKHVIKKGDVIVAKANVRHWNGVTPDKALVCMTITEHSIDGHVVQLRPVTDEEYGFPTLSNNNTAMCAKLPMSADGIIRLSKIEVDPAYLDEYMKYATEVGETSLRTEPGVLTMYAVQEKENPCNITILETYASQESYRSHIASAHFQKYKQGTLHMVKNLQLLDQTELNPSNKVVNYIK